MFESFIAYNANAFFAILYFLKHNYLFLLVLAAVAYMFVQEIIMQKETYVSDDRRIL